MSLNNLAKEIYEDAVLHGWWNEDASRNFGEAIALMHSELSEALEEDRKGYKHDYIYYRESDSKPEGVLVELADTIVRILDWVGSQNLDIDSVIREKMNFNKTREFKHGKKY